MSTDLIGVFPTIPAMTAAAIDHVRALGEHHLATQFQIDLDMRHTIHGGIYSRTCRLPASYEMTGALIKVPTTVIISGECDVWLRGEWQRFTGYAVLPASAGRKQAFRAVRDTHITMIFPTKAQTVAECEREFTDFWRDLAPGCAETVITGEVS